MPFFSETLTTIFPKNGTLDYVRVLTRRANIETNPRSKAAWLRMREVVRLFFTYFITAGRIYAYSSRIFRVDGHSLPYAWNHTIVYDSERYPQMPYLVELLTTRHIDVQYDDHDQLLKYHLTASIAKGLITLSS